MTPSFVFELANVRLHGLISFKLLNGKMKKNLRNLVHLVLPNLVPLKPSSYPDLIMLDFN